MPLKFSWFSISCLFVFQLKHWLYMCADVSFKPSLKYQVLLVRKDMDVNEHWRFNNAIVRHQYCTGLQEWRFYWYFTFLSHSRVFYNEYNTTRTLICDFLYCSLCFTDVVYPLTVIVCTVTDVSLTWSIPWQWLSVLLLMFHWRGLSPDSDCLYCYWCFTDVVYPLTDSDFQYCSLRFTDMVYPVIVISRTVPSVSLTWSIPWQIVIFCTVPSVSLTWSIPW